MVIDTIVMDSLKEKTDETEMIRVLVSGSPKELIQDYIQIAKEAKLEIAYIETESIAVIRSLVGNDPSRIMLVDIGAARTNITIAQERYPFLHRSVRAGSFKTRYAKCIQLWARCISYNLREFHGSSANINPKNTRCMLFSRK
jgi:Tfp pilus assembly PilM family ATPase